MVGHLFDKNNTKPQINEVEASHYQRPNNTLRRIYDNYQQHRGNSKCYFGTYVAILVLTALVSLVIFLPLLNRLNALAFHQVNDFDVPCGNSCRIELAESIPEGLVFNGTVNHSTTYEQWKYLVLNARESIDIASFYWTLRENETFHDPSSKKGEKIYQALLTAGLNRNITIRIAQNEPSTFQPNPDTEYLQKVNAAQVRSLNFTKLIGAGVLHSKFWIVDRKHVYIGSANMDWRALTQVKELGVVIYDCPCVAADLMKIFEVYWILGVKDHVPTTWPEKYTTKYNANSPLNVTFGQRQSLMYFSSSPPQFSPKGRTEDIGALLRTIATANKYIYISVMDYFPLTLYTKTKRFWPVIDDEIRRAIIDRGVNVRILVSHWKQTRPMIFNFMNSLKSLNRFDRKVKVEVKKFKVPSNASQALIPHARVNHNKYMVTDSGVLLGTSNWSGDYFINTSGVSLIMPVGNSTDNSIHRQLLDIFERDWSSSYASDIY